MKTLTKIKIINWHYFWNELIDVKPIVFLTGLNGSGKSTLIDALQVILLGDTTGRFFNKAAMDKSARTLKGYLRGELGDTMDGGFKYLRNGRFTSYIALEFFNDLENKYFVMGIVFDTFDDGNEEHRFFCLDDKMPDNEFIDEKIPMDYKKLSKFFNENYSNKFIFFDSNRQYQDFLKRKFGGLKDKYFSLLKKATSFSPITDITTFITEYVCDPQANIQLDVLQDNILQYKKLENEAKKINERIVRLETVNKHYNAYKTNNDNLNIAQYIVEKCELEAAKDKLEIYKRQVDKNKERLNNIEAEIADYRENLAMLDRKKVNLIRDKANNDISKLTDELLDQKKSTINQILQIEQNEKLVKTNLINLCDNYIKETDLLEKNLSSFNLEALDEEKAQEIQTLLDESSKISMICRDFKKKYSINLIGLTKEILNDLKINLASFKTKVGTLAISISRTSNLLNKKIASLKDEETSMKLGKKAYNPKLVEIKERLEEELFKKYNKSIAVNIFADLIDIKDLSWSNAIEGYLYNQKFNLLVEPKYYIDAYKILRNLLSERQFYGTALIDQERIIERNYQAEIGSLADEIKTNNDGARAYTNFLIGRLYKASSVEEARNSANGITKECDLYRNFSLSKINPRLYQESFIGSNVDDRFFEEKARQLKANMSNLDMYHKLANIITSANQLEVISTSEIESTFVLISKISTLDGLKKNLKYIEDELKEHDTTLIESLDRRISDIEDDIKSINETIEETLIEKGNLAKEIENIKNEKIKEQKNNIEAIIKRLSESYDPFLIKEQADPIFDKERSEGKTNIEILGEFNQQLSQLQYLVGNIKSALFRTRREYCQDYHLSYQIDCEDNEQFDAELHEFKDVKLPEYQEKIEDSYHKATQQFKDDFIFKLRSAIEDVEDQIDNLNEALKQASFGRDLYRFTVKPSQIYRRYYDMLKDDLILETGEDESEFINKYKDVMEDLFKQIVDIGEGNKNSELMENIAKFTDYRSYLDFDLIVYNKETAEEQRLSKMIKKKSGGETQTPFYIAVLASFAQLYHVNDEGELGNTTRIIIFDEAFSKMDRGRIKVAVNLLKEFNLQVILSAPSDKVGDISELVDETLVVLHDKNSSCVKLYAKDTLN